MSESREIGVIASEVFYLNMNDGNILLLEPTNEFDLMQAPQNIYILSGVDFSIGSLGRAILALVT